MRGALWTGVHMSLMNIPGQSFCSIAPGDSPRPASLLGTSLAGVSKPTPKRLGITFMTVHRSFKWPQISLGGTSSICRASSYLPNAMIPRCLLLSPWMSWYPLLLSRHRLGGSLVKFRGVESIGFAATGLTPHAQDMRWGNPIFADLRDSGSGVLTP